MDTSDSRQSAGLARWRAESAGQIEPPAELRDLRRRYGWSERQISYAFEAFQGVQVHPVNGFYLIFERELTSREISNLMKEQLIRIDRDGWALTRKGEELLNLLNTYGDPKYRWGMPAITF